MCLLFQSRTTFAGHAAAVRGRGMQSRVRRRVGACPLDRLGLCRGFAGYFVRVDRLEFDGVFDLQGF
jgi:hypothetical protein